MQPRQRGNRECAKTSSLHTKIAGTKSWSLAQSLNPLGQGVFKGSLAEASALYHNVDFAGLVKVSIDI